MRPARMVSRRIATKRPPGRDDDAGSPVDQGHGGDPSPGREQPRFLGHGARAAYLGDYVLGDKFPVHSPDDGRGQQLKQRADVPAARCGQKRFGQAEVR